MRIFEKLGSGLHERFSFPVISRSHAASMVFRCSPSGNREPIGELGAHEAFLERILLIVMWDESGTSVKTPDTLEEVSCECDPENMPVYLTLARAGPLPGADRNCFWRALQRLIRFVSIPNSVEELS